MNEVNEGLEYAQMLEIPVSTVNVVKKKSLFSRRSKPADDLKDRVVDSVNERVGEEAPLPDNNIGFVQTEDLTAPVKVKNKKKKMSTGSKIVMGEAIAACLIAAGIFVTNIFVPDTVINTFMGKLTAVKPKEVSYTDFTLTSPVSELSDAEVTVTDNGVISFKDKTSVYPLCDGEINSVTQDNGLYTVKISHTSSFTSVVTGLDTVYAAVGEEVKGNLPFAYSDGENEVRVSMYDGEQLLNCYTLSGAVPVWNS